MTIVLKLEEWVDLLSKENMRQWVAQLVEADICSQGDTASEAVDNLMSQVRLEGLLLKEEPHLRPPPRTSNHVIDVMLGRKRRV